MFKVFSWILKTSQLYLRSLQLEWGFNTVFPSFSQDFLFLKHLKHVETPLQNTWLCPATLTNTIINILPLNKNLLHRPSWRLECQLPLHHGMRKRWAGCPAHQHSFNTSPQPRRLGLCVESLGVTSLSLLRRITIELKEVITSNVIVIQFS